MVCCKVEGLQNKSKSKGHLLNLSYQVLDTQEEKTSIVVSLMLTIVQCILVTVRAAQRCLTTLSTLLTVFFPEDMPLMLVHEDVSTCQASAHTSIVGLLVKNKAAAAGPI